jgi:uncharacterized membrane protein
MSSKLVALAFDGQYTAEGMLDTLKQLQKDGAIELEDAVVISRGVQGEQLYLNPSGVSGGAPAIAQNAQAEIEQTTHRRGRAAAAGAGIGLFAGWLLGGPIGGAVVGTLIGGLRDRGIDDKFAKDIASHLHSDSSALLLLVKRADPDKVLAAIQPFKGTILLTDLSPETEKTLRAALVHGE